MEMVAAARLRRAEQRIEALRPVRRRDPADDAPGRRGGRRRDLRPAGAPGARVSENKVALLLVTGDRGLAGAFNSQIIRAGLRARREHEGEGRDGRLLRRRPPRRVDADVPQARARRAPTSASPTGPRTPNAREIADDLIAAYVDGEVDRVEIFYNGYVSPLTQEVRRETLLPLQQATILEGDEDEDDEARRSDEHAATTRSSSTSPTPTRSSAASSRSTSRSRSTARCSSPPRPSTARA